MPFFRASFLALLLLTLTAASGIAQRAPLRDMLNPGQASNLEKALLEATTRLDQAIENGDPQGEAIALNDMGAIYLHRIHDYEKAMDYFIEALVIEDSLGLGREQMVTYVGMARVFETVGDFYRSSQLLEQASGTSVNFDIDDHAVILNYLGKIYAAMGNMEAALQKYEQVLRYDHDLDDGAAADALFNLGHLYTLQGKYTEAMQHHKRALTLRRSIGDRAGEALALHDIGELYRLMQQPARSEENHEVALRIRKDLNDKPGMASSYYHLGLLAHQRRDFQSSVAHLLLALELGRESQAQEVIFKSYDLLSQSYKESGDFKSALNYKELSLAISEFIQNEKYERHLLEAQNRYVIGKKENQIEQLEALRLEREKEILAQKKFRNILVALIVLSLAVVGLIFILYVHIRKSNKELKLTRDKVQQQNVSLQELNATKDKFFSILGHDLKGPLNSLTSFSHLLIDHTDSLSKEDIQMLARDLDKSVKNLFSLLENLLEWSRSQTGNIQFDPEVFDLTRLMDQNISLFEHQARSKKIKLLLQASGACPVKLHKHSVNTVIRNLVSNAIKFTPENGTVTLALNQTPQQMTFSVRDTGVGMTPEVIAKLFRLDVKYSTKGTASEKGTGLGLILCKDFVEKNGGNIKVTSVPGKGSEFLVTFPREVMQPVLIPG